jgi:hypothetical protein
MTLAADAGVLVPEEPQKVLNFLRASKRHRTSEILSCQKTASHSAKSHKKAPEQMVFGKTGEALKCLT